MKGAATMKGVLTGHLGVELLEERTRSSFYAQRRNFNFSSPHARSWYADHNGHYLDDGVEFFWNDEGETDYYTYYWWNVAQRDELRKRNATKRFFSINRAFSPGNARLGAAVWTGDIHPTWDALRNTPALVLSWGLAGCAKPTNPVCALNWCLLHLMPERLTAHVSLFACCQNALCRLRHRWVRLPEHAVASDALVSARHTHANDANPQHARSDTPLALALGRTLCQRDASGTRAALPLAQLPLLVRAPHASDA